MCRGLQRGMASAASHCVKLEGDRVLQFDLVCFALTIPVVSYFSAMLRLGEGSGLSSVQSAAEPLAGIAVVQRVGVLYMASQPCLPGMHRQVKPPILSRQVASF